VAVSVTVFSAQRNAAFWITPQRPPLKKRSLLEIIMGHSCKTSEKEHAGLPWFLPRTTVSFAPMVAPYFNGPPNKISRLGPLIPVAIQPGMRTRRLANGQVAYYWDPPRRAKREGLPIHGEPLGTNFVEAVRRALRLNALCQSFPAKLSKKSKTISALTPFRQEFRAAA
jgi:hypothetical protein